jgi:glycosyltransferase involved in cell wall biosynthesis
VSKKIIVISAVNCVEGGILSVLQDSVASICKEYGAEWRVIVLANNRSLIPDCCAHVMEFPRAKRSWIARLLYEFIIFRKLSKEIDPDVWFSLHDISPNVLARRQVVYCHNPNPFYPLQLRDAVRNWKFTAFSLFYGWLYAINIHSNDYVIVQQNWLRREFQRRYKLNNVMVAHPEGADWPVDGRRAHLSASASHPDRFRFFYPFVPKFFKNAEVVCKAATILHEGGHREFEIVLTLDGTENGYARSIRQLFGSIPNIVFAGRLPRGRVFDLYRSSDCLVFASRLETWGLPITEFKATARPMLIADFPYARETVGAYPNAEFFNADDAVELAKLMLEVLSGAFRPKSHAVPAPTPPPFAADWSSLWAIVLKD